MLKLSAALGSLLLTATVTCSAQQSPSRFALEQDSLLQRAALIRTQTNRQLVTFKASFASVSGTRRKVISYRFLTASDSTSANPLYQRTKVHTMKHKTSGVDVKKIFYYYGAKNSVLREWYQQQELVRLELTEYFPDGKVHARPLYRKTVFLRGSYLSHQILPRAGRGTKQAARYFFAPKPGQEEQ